MYRRQGDPLLRANNVTIFRPTPYMYAMHDRDVRSPPGRRYVHFSRASSIGRRMNAV